jgi:ABC-type polysaccharide/polyol phosphate export permease
MQLVPRTIAEYNPLSAIVAAIRQVTQGTGVAYCTLITVICLSLAVRKFRKPA